jgi:hypothetical protein
MPHDQQVCGGKITNITKEKFNSYAQVGMPCSKTKAEIENVEKTKVRLTAPGKFMNIPAA